MTADLEPLSGTLGSLPGRVLIVDDAEPNRRVLSFSLRRQGHSVEFAVNGFEALEKIATGDFDLVLLDLMMPEMDGFEVLERLRADGTLFQLPVILISAVDDVDRVARCIEVGAEDYLAKPFNPILLQARIRACLEKKRLRDREQTIFQAMRQSQKQLAAELGQAADYVRSLLPAPLSGEVSTDWRFVPSTRLGGDAFGYHWLDGERLALYLLDVCGHGVGAALLSVSAINAVRSGTLPDTDFGDPSAVLAALNQAFQMADHNDQYFTIWYGVYDRGSRTLAYASGGHPPAILVHGPPAQPVLRQLRTRGTVIGAVPGIDYPAGVCEIPKGSRLYVFSDGVYEIKQPDGNTVVFDRLLRWLVEEPQNDGPAVERLLRAAEAARGPDGPEDDVSLLEVVFN